MPLVHDARKWCVGVPSLDLSFLYPFPESSLLMVRALDHDALSVEVDAAHVTDDLATHLHLSVNVDVTECVR